MYNGVKHMIKREKELLAAAIKAAAPEEAKDI
jgi:hypothetical protein